MAKKATRKKTAGSKRTASASKRPARGRTAKPSPAAAYKGCPAGTSDKDHLIGVIQAGTDSTKKAATETLKAVLGTVTASLKKNKKVQLVGFGSFDIAKRRARKGRNPATGEAIRIKASKRVRFRAGTELKGGI